MPIDDPPDRLYGLIVHELTHQFEFDIIPQGLIRRSVPLWVERRAVRTTSAAQWDAARSDDGPRRRRRRHRAEDEPDSKATATRATPRLIYNLGHAVFEFIEAKLGKEGIRQFLFSLRKSVIGGGEDAYEEALQMKPDEFDQAFERYLKERFKPFRDKERPADYGRDLAPNRGADRVHAGALDRAVALGRSDRRGHRQPQGSASSTSSWSRRRTARSSAT